LGLLVKLDYDEVIKSTILDEKTKKIIKDKITNEEELFYICFELF
jgi:hypothetical protein